MDELQALRARGAEHFDPVRWRFIEALARRTQAQAGAARQLLDARLQRLLADYAAAFAAAAAQPAAAPPTVAAPAALHGLNAYIAGHAAPAGSALQSLDWFRRTWSRISVGRRMTQSLAKKPENAGPINSHGLVLRALQQLGAVSPDYLDRFVDYADALLALDQASGGSALLHRDVLHRDLLRAPGTAAAAAPKRPRTTAGTTPSTTARATARADTRADGQLAVTTLRKRLR